MASYPRSGNTLLRTWLERVMGIYTGSDGTNGVALHQALMDIGLEGEGVADKRVQIVKTHYPERNGSVLFPAQKTILLVRSPLDCIISLFHMDGTASHDCSILDSDFETFRLQWEEYFRLEMSVWRDFQNSWMKQNVPCHIIRYEDLVERPAVVIPELFKFIFNTNKISDTLLESYINFALNEGAQKTYKPRVGRANANIDKYTQAMFNELAATCGDQMKCLGFYQHLNQPDSANFTTQKAVDWIQSYNRKQLDFILSRARN